MSDNLHPIESRYLVLSDDRFVGVVDLCETKGEKEPTSKGLIFCNKDGKISRVQLSLEAFEALKQLMLDKSCGTTEYPVLEKRRWVNIGGKQTEMLYGFVDGKEVEKARKAAENGDTVTQTG